MSYISNALPPLLPSPAFSSRFGARPRPPLPIDLVDPPIARRPAKTPEISRDALYASLMGTKISVGKFIQNRHDKAILSDQTEEIADSLDRYGETCRVETANRLRDVIVSIDARSPVRPILDDLAGDLDRMPIHQWNRRSRDAWRSISDPSIYMGVETRRLVDEIYSVLEVVRADKPPNVCEIFWQLENLAGALHDRFLYDPTYRSPSMYFTLHRCEALIFDHHGIGPPRVWRRRDPAALARGQAEYRKILRETAEILGDIIDRLRGDAECRRDEAQKFLRETGVFREIQTMPYGRSARTGLASVDLNFGFIDPLPCLRDIKLLPSVAQSKCRDFANQLILFLESADIPRDAAQKSFVRYAVVTSGDRVPIYGDLDGRLSEHHRKISKWSHEIKRRFGMIVALRSTENTYKKSGVHVHSNILYYPQSYLSPDKFDDFLVFTRHYFGAAWKDCKRVDDIEKIARYCIKTGSSNRVGEPSSDLIGLMGEPGVDADALVGWVYEHTLRHRSIAPMRDFAKFRRGFEKARKTIGYTAENQRVVTTRATKLTGAGGDDLAGENVVLSISLPSTNHTHFRSARAIVLNPTTTPATQRGAERLQNLIDYARQANDAWKKNSAISPAEALAEARKERIPVRNPEVDWPALMVLSESALTVPLVPDNERFSDDPHWWRPPPADPPPSIAA